MKTFPLRLVPAVGASPRLAALSFREPEPFAPAGTLVNGTQDLVTVNGLLAFLLLSPSGLLSVSVEPYEEEGSPARTFARDFGSLPAALLFLSTSETFRTFEGFEDFERELTLDLSDLDGAGFALLPEPYAPEGFASR
jgi:hypothetical protein